MFGCLLAEDRTCLASCLLWQSTEHVFLTLQPFSVPYRTVRQHCILKMVSANPARCVNMVVQFLISPSAISVSFFLLSLLYLLVVTTLSLSRLATTKPAIVISLLHFFVKHRAGCRWNADDVLTDSAVQPVTDYYIVVWKTLSLTRGPEFVALCLPWINCY